MTKGIEKEQYAKIAQFWLHWLKQHPNPKDDDDFHKVIRESAETYLDLYESWLDIYTYIVKTTYIPTNKKHPKREKLKRHGFEIQNNRSVKLFFLAIL